MFAHGLIESALEDAGTALAVIAHPERGPAATIEHANAPFCAIMRQPRALLQSLPFGDAIAIVATGDSRHALLRALEAGQPAQLDLHLCARAPERWFGLRLVFPANPEPHAVLTGRDITDRHLVTAQQDDTRRMLAAIFLRIEAPVAIVTADGAISMANPAFHHLTGYARDDLAHLRADDLVAPEHRPAIRTARAKQLADGEHVEMACELLANGGNRIRVRLTSVLLRDGDQRMRVVTIAPIPAPLPHPNALPRPGDIGELRAISLQAVRAAFGPAWTRIATRAMLTAERTIRRTLDPADTLGRIDDHSFAIWFHGLDHDANAATLARIARDVRLAFLAEFGDALAAHVAATLVSVGPPAARPAGRPSGRLVQAGTNWTKP